MSWLRKAARAGCAALMASTMAVVLDTGRASAATVITDGFESSTEAEWNLWTGGPELCFAPRYGSTPICEAPGQWWFNPGRNAAHSGEQSLTLMNAGDYDNYTVADRYVDLPVSISCSASVFVKPFYTSDAGPIRAKIEVIDPGPWEKVNKKTFELYREDVRNWQQFTVTWTGNLRSVVIRLLIRGTANYHSVSMNADDLEVSCVRPSTKP